MSLDLQGMGIAEPRSVFFQQVDIAYRLLVLALREGTAYSVPRTVELENPPEIHLYHIFVLPAKIHLDGLYHNIVI